MKELAGKLKQIQSLIGECCDMCNATPSEGNYDDQDDMEGGPKTAQYGKPMESDVGKDENIRMKAKVLAKKLGM